MKNHSDTETSDKKHSTTLTLNGLDAKLDNNDIKVEGIPLLQSTLTTLSSEVLDNKWDVDNKVKELHLLRENTSLEGSANILDSIIKVEEFPLKEDENTHEYLQVKEENSTNEDSWRIDTEDKPYQCSQCDKAFSLNFHLIRHMMIHTGGSYKCNKCDMCFSYTTDLIKHMRIHTDETPYQCSKCEKAFTTNNSLKVHMRTHTGVKSYQCSHCGKKFADNSTLVRHIRMHTGEKPYKCIQCDKTFRTITQFKLHSSIHTGEKPYQCSQCDMAFAHKGHLNRHKLGRNHIRSIP